MGRYELILFDVDDTLLDFRSGQRRAFEATARAALGGEGTGPEVDQLLAHYLEVSGPLWRDLEDGRISMQRLAVRRWELVAERSGLDYDAGRISARYLELLAAEHQTCVGALQLCERLARSHRLAAVTNGYEAVQAPRLRAAGLERHLELVLTSEAAGVGKPHAAIFEHALERLGRVEPEQVLMVGDSLSSDIAGAEAVGLGTCWISRGRPLAASDPQPDHIITGVAELERVL
ncbi:MAG: YjjG family noncanonical pyrimidine nucleotidase [Myxococcales bacterium]|jgi:2-haloacid dehalogenase